MLEQVNLTYEKVVLIGIINQLQTEEKSKEYLDELEFLTYTAGGEVLKRFTQKLDVPNPKTFIGTGKMEEVQQYVEENEVGTVIFDDELTPAQQKNIERILKAKILDRTGLILDIFAQRAQTSYSRTQVELAQYEYLLPRLTGLWTHLERQRGGIGMRGPGETEIETDRRIVRDRIALLKKKLSAIDKQMATQRSNRGALVRVALIGYTNVGKSTLMNVISKSEVFAENKLFATLDTTVRKVILHNLPFLMSDTVGFIRKLPTELIESFKSTLDEVREADLLLHVVDLSHPDFESQIAVVEATLREILGNENKPTLLIFNKIDAFTFTPKDEDDLTPKSRENYSREELERSWMAKLGQNCLFVSAHTGDDIEGLRALLYDKVREIHIKRYPYDDFLFQDYNEAFSEEGLVED